MEFKIDGNILIFRPAKSVYSVDVLHKCFYWYGGDYDVTIGESDADHYEVTLIANGADIHVPELMAKIKRDLIDFKLRDIVTKETQTIRELIVAKAFAYYEDESQPQTELSDPVGFDPKLI